MRKQILLTLLFCAGATLFAGKEHLREYPFTRTAELTGVPGETAAIRFDQNLYKNTNEDYSNLKVLDQNGNTVPHTVRLSVPMKTVTEYQKVPGKISAFSLDKEKNSAFAEYTLKEPERAVSKLSFDTRSSVFNKKVTLQFFDKSGKLLAEEKDLPLYQYKDVYGSPQVSFPEIKAAKIRVTIHQFSERKEAEYRQESSGSAGNNITQSVRNEAFDLKGITVYEGTPRNVPGSAVQIPAELPEISRSTKGKITEITVAAHRIPCCSVKLSCDEKHYHRTVEISLKKGGKTQLLATAKITPENKGKIQLPEQRGDLYQIKIYNGDDAPLKNIRLEWNVKERTVIVIPPKEGNLTLYYGGKADKQVYDIEHYADRFGLPPQIYKLGEETPSPEYAPALPTEDLSRYFMWAVLAIAAVVLGIFIIRMLNKSSEISEGSD